MFKSWIDVTVCLLLRNSTFKPFNMYPLSRSVFLRCFHCSYIPCCPLNALHCTEVHTLGKQGINAQNIPEISKPVHGQAGLSIGLSNVQDRLSLRDTSNSNVKLTNSSKSRGNKSLLCWSERKPTLVEDNRSSQSRFFSTSPIQTHSFERKYKSSLAKYKSFTPHRMLVLPKVTRFSYEKGRFPQLSESELRYKLAERGSDYEHLVERHSVHMKNLQDLIENLEQSGATVKVCETMKDFTEEAVNWADLVISAGGDGTFLSASRKVFGDKPIIGVNTDFAGSEGFLCLPKKYSGNIARALKLMKNGSYRWRKRARIRVTVKGGDTSHPIDLYDEDLTYSDHRQRHNSERQKSLERRLNGETSEGHVIPIRALNEVFVGESLSSRMSYYEISLDDGPLEKQKSSGITICTGTGSTSWSFNINKLSYQSVEEVLKIANHLTGSNYPTNQESVKTVADSFNGRLLFDPRVLQMVYTVRDPVVYGLFQVKKPRGFARKITIRSRCRDACLTVDAGTSYVFNDGAIATLEMFDEDSIKTIELVE